MPVTYQPNRRPVLGNYPCSRAACELSLLPPIAGVYSVAIDVDNHKVSVTGDVDAETLIRKLTRGGKHAELWTQQKGGGGGGNQGHKGNNQQKQQQNHQQQHQQQQKQGANPGKDVHSNKNNSGGQKDQGKQGGVGSLMQGLKAFKSQHNNKHQLPELDSEEDDMYDDEDDEFDDDYEEELRYLGDKMSQLGFHSNSHHQNQTKNGNNAAVNNNHNNGKKGGNGTGGGVAVNHHQNQKNANVINMAAANAKMGAGVQNQKNANGINMAAAAAAAANAKMATGAQRNTGAMPGMLGLSHGLGAGNAAPGFQGYTGFNHPSYAAAGYGGLQQQHHLQQQQSNNLMASMQGYHHHPAATAAMMNNLRGLNSNMMMMHQPQQQQQQPQMMYHSSPQISPYTGYYNPYNYYYHPHPGSAGYPASNGDVETMFSDENTKGCVVM